MGVQSQDVGFPHSCELNEGELWVGVTLSGWIPMTWASMKGASRSVRPGVDSKPQQTT
ncbi:MAG: hypothetical protein QXD36_01245 [Sulfolobales archaeon]